LQHIMQLTADFLAGVISDGDYEAAMEDYGSGMAETTTVVGENQ
jgi:hypothetical protein